MLGGSLQWNSMSSRGNSNTSRSEVGIALVVYAHAAVFTIAELGTKFGTYTQNGCFSITKF
jgi:hypothetical protein